jgi:hypothetical protein
MKATQNTAVLRARRLLGGGGVALWLGLWAAPVSAAETAPAPASTSAWPTLPKDVELGPGRLDISLQQRLRYEYTDNFTVRGYGTGEGDHLLLSRTRLGLDYRLPENAHVFVQLQDARFFLSDLEDQPRANSSSHYNQCELKQAYVEWQYILGTPLGLKVGRQSISYADNRVFGPGEWGNVGRYWWDVAKLTLNLDLVQVDVLHGQRLMMEQSSWDDDHYPFRMSGVYARWKRLPMTVDTFWLHRYSTHDNLKGEDPGAGRENRHTWGVAWDGTWRKQWDYGGTLASQTGSYAKDDIRAYGVNLRGGYTFAAPWSPRLGAEYTYASGDSDPKDGVKETFDNVYGAVDTVYGRINFLAWKNLEDYQLTAGVKPTRNTKFWVDYHLFRLAEADDAWYWSSGAVARRDRTGAAGRDLGQEIDVLFQWKVSKQFDWFCGYCYFFPGDFIRQTPGPASGADWFFSQVTASF